MTYIKKNIDKYRANHREEYNTYQNKYHKEWYNLHHERLSKRKLEQYYFKKAFLQLCRLYEAQEN